MSLNHHNLLEARKGRVEVIKQRILAARIRPEVLTPDSRYKTLSLSVESVRSDSNVVILIPEQQLTDFDIIGLRIMSVFVGCNLRKGVRWVCDNVNVNEDETLAVLASMNYTFNYPGLSGKEVVKLKLRPGPVERTRVYGRYSIKAMILDMEAFLTTTESDFYPWVDPKPDRRRGVLIVAPPTSGKTTLVKKFRERFGEGFYDGDSLVEWPEEHQWWKVMSKADQRDLGVTHLMSLSNFAARKGALVMFAPNMESFKLVKESLPCRVIGWLPEITQHKRNAIARRKNPLQGQLTFSELVSARKELLSSGLRVLVGDFEPVGNWVRKPRVFVDGKEVFFNVFSRADVLRGLGRLRSRSSLGRLSADEMSSQIPVDSDVASMPMNQLNSLHLTGFANSSMSNLGASLLEKNLLGWGRVLRVKLMMLGRTASFVDDELNKAKQALAGDVVAVVGSKTVEFTVGNRKVDTSGHLFTMLVASVVADFDLNRYVDVILYFKNLRGDQYPDEGTIDLREDQRVKGPRLLHTLIDYQSAVLAFMGLIMTKRIFDFSLRVVERRCGKLLRSIRDATDSNYLNGSRVGEASNPGPPKRSREISPDFERVQKKAKTASLDLVRIVSSGHMIAPFYEKTLVFRNETAFLAAKRRVREEKKGIDELMATANTLAADEKEQLSKRVSQFSSNMLYSHLSRIGEITEVKSPVLYYAWNLVKQGDARVKGFVNEFSNTKAVLKIGRGVYGTFGAYTLTRVSHFMQSGVHHQGQVSCIPFHPINRVDLAPVTRYTNSGRPSMSSELLDKKPIHAVYMSQFAGEILGKTTQEVIDWLLSKDDLRCTRLAFRMVRHSPAPDSNAFVMEEMSPFPNVRVGDLILRKIPINSVEIRPYEGLRLIVDLLSVSFEGICGLHYCSELDFWVVRTASKVYMCEETLTSNDLIVTCMGDRGMDDYNHHLNGLLNYAKEVKLLSVSKPIVQSFHRYSKNLPKKNGVELSCLSMVEKRLLPIIESFCH